MAAIRGDTEKSFNSYVWRADHTTALQIWDYLREITGANVQDKGRKKWQNMTMGKMTALAYNVQVTNHLAECVREGVVMDNDDILSHYLTSLNTTGFQEVLAEVNTKRTIHSNTMES